MMLVESETKETVVVKDEKKGWLSKRTQFTHRWKPTWFQLKDAQLVYGEEEERPVKTISLVGALVETDGCGPSGWTITPKDRKRTVRLRAGSAAERQSWLLALCEAQLHATQRGANVCVVQ